jgi:hypothetical protein
LISPLVNDYKFSFRLLNASRRRSYSRVDAPMTIGRRSAE